MHTLIVLVITSTVSLLAGWFAWEDSARLITSLRDGYVWLSYDWMTLAIPGILVSTVTLTLLTTTRLVANRIPTSIAKVSAVLLIAGVALAIIGRIGGGKLLNDELAARDYSPCLPQSRTAIFSNLQIWTLHPSFCNGGPDIEKLTLETMRRDILKYNKEKK
ncbi:MAG: hypothetical protein GY799_06175 [Desulfobulbaceae bacterium]|nr:hypothetical protein [Desulfobulbaceae bacterium]